MIFDDASTWTDEDYDLSELSPEEWPAWALDDARGSAPVIDNMVNPDEIARVVDSLAKGMGL